MAQIRQGNSPRKYVSPDPKTMSRAGWGNLDSHPPFQGDDDIWSMTQVIDTLDTQTPLSWHRADPPKPERTVSRQALLGFALVGVGIMLGATAILLGAVVSLRLEQRASEASLAAPRQEPPVEARRVFPSEEPTERETPRPKARAVKGTEVSASVEYGGLPQREPHVRDAAEATPEKRLETATPPRKALVKRPKRRTPRIRKRPRRPRPSPAPRAPTEYERLTRAEVLDGLRPVRPRGGRCLRRGDIEGVVKVSIRISHGRATLLGTDRNVSSKTRQCLSAAVRSIKLRTTWHDPLLVVYPFSSRS